jgi:hypothetical protein
MEGTQNLIRSSRLCLPVTLGNRRGLREISGDLWTFIDEQKIEKLMKKANQDHQYRKEKE